MFVNIVRQRTPPLGHFRRFFADSIEPIRMAYTTFGQEFSVAAGKHPLIILHGLFGYRKNFRTIAAKLSKKLHRKVYTVDARNHGDSPHAPVHSSASMAADLVEFMNEHNIDKGCLMGHSMGGRTVMYFTMKYPHLVDRGIVIDISPITIPREVVATSELFEAIKSVELDPTLKLAQARKEASRQIRHTVDSQSTANFIAMNLREHQDGGFYWAVNVEGLHANVEKFTTYHQRIEHLPRYAGPMTFICAKKSNFFNPEDWPQVHSMFPNSEIYWVNTGHLVHLEKPKELIKIVVKSMKKL